MKSSLHICFVNKRKGITQESYHFSRNEAEEAASLERERFGTEYDFIAENRTHQTYICDFCKTEKSVGRKHEEKDICPSCYKKSLQGKLVN